MNATELSDSEILKLISLASSFAR